MSEYKRLTKRVNGRAAKIKTSTSDYVGTIYEEEQVLQQEIIERLAELEDKIETGKLVELPCKVGDIVYRVRAYHRKKYEIIERICFSITYQGKNKWEIFSTTDDILGDSVFLTREAAETRLKDLEGKYKNGV